MEKSVLVIDDTDEIRFSIRRILEKCDSAVFEAYSIDSAFEVLNNQSIDVVFSDLHLPQPKDGELILAETRSKLPAIKIVMMSCAMDFASQSKYSALGASECLQKPFFRDKCQEVLHKLGSATAQ